MSVHYLLHMSVPSNPRVSSLSLTTLHCESIQIQKSEVILGGLYDDICVPKFKDRYRFPTSLSLPLTSHPVPVTSSNYPSLPQT